MRSKVFVSTDVNRPSRPALKHVFLFHSKCWLNSTFLNVRNGKVSEGLKHMPKQQ